jgi:membrane-bound inhibitor of C-type lysozyme
MLNRFLNQAGRLLPARATLTGGMAAILALLLAGCWTSDEAATLPQPAGKSAAATYLCPDGTVIHARYYIDAKLVDFTLGDSTEPVRLPIAMSGSGARYSDGASELWEHQGKVRVTLPDGTVYDGCPKQK